MSMRGATHQLISMDELAEQGMKALEEAPDRDMRPIRDRIKTCMLCLGQGRERSKWGFLWGYCCWSCGGWGFHLDDNLVLRGPFTPRPVRYGGQGGSDDAANRDQRGSDSDSGHVRSDRGGRGDGRRRNGAGRRAGSQR